MKNLYFILLASVLMLMASCDKSSDYAEPQPAKQGVQMVPQAIQELIETGGTLVQAVYPYTFTKYTIDSKNGGTEYNTVYFYANAELTTPVVLLRDMECKYKIVHCGIYSGNNDPEILSISESKVVTIPRGSSSYVLFEGPYRNMMGGYSYHNYVLIEGVRYVNM